MNCQLCKSNPAKVHFTLAGSPQLLKVDICTECHALMCGLPPENHSPDSKMKIHVYIALSDANRRPFESDKIMQISHTLEGQAAEAILQHAKSATTKAEADLRAIIALALSAPPAP